jgi:hypothetical protein
MRLMARVFALGVAAALAACSTHSVSFTPGDAQGCAGRGDCNDAGGSDGGTAHGAARLGANASVAGGDRSRSPHYLLIHTLGQPTQNQQKTVSPGYRIQGGLSGATGR